ncbi:MAG: putative integral rane protein [Frankiales bacterium]|nr:putative integral rane protein [Frankiales bacterium]
MVDGGFLDASQARRSGFGRVLVAVYAVLALGATARSLTQLISHYSTAPLAYLLSLFAGVVYCIATYGLAGRRVSSWRLAFIAISVELVGVLVVGTASLVAKSAFPDDTVWSRYGSGYGFIPAVLPVVGLWWLRRTHVPELNADAR